MLKVRSDVESSLPNPGGMRKMHCFTAVVSEMHNNHSGVRGYFPIQEPHFRDSIGGEHRANPATTDLRLREMKRD
jgi:hypothetical protein